jgi:hypothetical protein
MTEVPTEREAELIARIKILENASANSGATAAEGGVFESVWLKISEIVPPWLAAIALVVLVAHYGFGYYIQPQISAAETELQRAKSDVETAEAKVANTPNEKGVIAELEALQVGTDQKRAEAAAAKVKAEALGADVNGETVALAAARAELDNTQNQARVAQAKADAEGAKFGLLTLRDRAVRATLIIQQTEIIKERVKTAEALAGSRMDDVMHMSYSNRVMAAGLRAACEGNQFADMIGCPSQFIQRTPRQSDSPQVATAPADENGKYWKPTQSCLGNLRGFNREAPHGAFAVTKISQGGGCGWSVDAENRKSAETLRREALAQCARHGAECKVISER